MAAYVRYRMAAAKLGVITALLGLVDGLTGKATAKSPAGAHAAVSSQFLKLGGLPGNIANQFVKLEIKLLQSIDGIDLKLSRNYYDKRGANAQFLKITTAQADYLKISDANTNFLKIDDANRTYLKLDGTAADSHKLGGLTPDQFVQGKGNVMTAELSVSNSTQQNSVLMGDGSVKILIGLTQPANGGQPQPQVTLENDGTTSLSFTFNGGTLSGKSTTTVPPGGTSALLPAVQSQNGGGQLDVQIIGGDGKARTLTISAISGSAEYTFVGQMLIGLL